MTSTAILMATYNSTRFLDDQLASIAAQTDRDFRMVVADDNSSDNTYDMIEQFGNAQGIDISIRRNVPGNAGAKKNFATLLAENTADYVFLCDHDDIWNPTKIAEMKAAMQAAEREVGPDVPVLVFSDLQVVDDQNREIASSFWAYSNLDPTTTQHFDKSLINAVVVGCATMMNKALVDMASPVPKDCAMHDWWCHLVAAAFGRVVVLETPLVQYRQHGSNVSGSSDRRLGAIMRSGSKAAWVRRGLDRRYLQAQAFLDRFETKLKDPDLAAVRAFVGMRDQGFAGRRISFLRSGLRHNTTAKNAATLLFM